MKIGSAHLSGVQITGKWISGSLVFLAGVFI
jgi:hypothetical protein